MWSGVLPKWEKISQCRFQNRFRLVNKLATLTYRKLLGIKVISVYFIHPNAIENRQGNFLTAKVCRNCAITFRLCIWCKTTDIMFCKTCVFLDESVGTRECGSSRPEHHRFKPTHSTHGHSHRPRAGARVGTSKGQKPRCRTVCATHIDLHLLLI